MGHLCLCSVAVRVTKNSRFGVFPSGVLDLCSTHTSYLWCAASRTHAAEPPTGTPTASPRRCAPSSPFSPGRLAATLLSLHDAATPPPGVLRPSAGPPGPPARSPTESAARLATDSPTRSNTAPARASSAMAALWPHSDSDSSQRCHRVPRRARVGSSHRAG